MIQAAYIHIPFCEHICHYCDFNKVFLQGQPVDAYLDHLDKEISLYIPEGRSAEMKTVFVGGGTPTALNEQQLEKLCSIIKERFTFDEETEFTFEANPGDLSAEKLKILHDAGVNRLSFGVQTFNDKLLEKIGRVHRAKDVFESIESARKIGFQNISVDLIYSLPGQTLQDFKETLDIAFTLDIAHFSGYSLIIEPKTVFYNLMRKGRLPLPGEDAEAEMYELLIGEMARHGYHQYEISNFSLPGMESRHNLTYWDNDHYYGFGAGAHSYVNGCRRSNYGPLKKYMEPLAEGTLPIMEENVLSQKEKMEEEMFLGLRKTAGISAPHFIEKFAVSPTDYFAEEITKLKDSELIEIEGDYIRLTKQGRFLGNEVFQTFLK